MGLIKRQVTDRNGVITSRWVRPEKDTLGDASQIPTPSLWTAQSRVEESFRDKLDKALDKRRYSKGNSRAEDDYIISIVAQREGENSDMMRVLLLNAEGSVNSMRDVRNVYMSLQKEGYTDPSRYMTPENVALWRRLFSELLPRSGKKITLNGRPDPNAFDVVPLCVYAVTAHPDKQPLIEHLLVERKFHDVDQLKAMVELDDVATSLVDGTL